MYALVQTGMGVVEAHRLPYCDRRSSKKKTMLEFRVRVSQLQLVQTVRDTRRKLQPHHMIWSSFGILKGSVDYERGELSARVLSVAPRAQVPPGDVSVLTETVREGESLRNSEFVGAAEYVDEDGVVAIGYGWKVREASKFDTEELRSVAHVQASSFHLQTGVFDELFFKLFKAEILSALLYKARHSLSDRYACLLAEPAILMDDGESGDELAPAIVGAVNLAASVDNDVLRHLHSASEYLYVSGMAVDVNFRRKNVATLLLRACELLAMKWGFDYLVLHAYEDDTPARTLYARGGYRVIALDPMWMSTWVGRKRRVLMAKRTPNFDF